MVIEAILLLFFMRIAAWSFKSCCIALAEAMEIGFPSASREPFTARDVSARVIAPARTFIGNSFKGGFTDQVLFSFFLYSQKSDDERCSMILRS